MTYSKKAIVFVAIGEYQSKFYYDVSKYINEYEVYHVCFDEIGVDWLKKHNCKVYNPYDYFSKDALDHDFSEYSIDNPSLLLSHEKVARRESSTQKIINNFKFHLYAMDEILSDIDDKANDLRVIQELGGFAPVLAAHYVAISKGFDSWMMEPSLFRGRFFFTKNSISSPVVSMQSSKVSDDLKRYIQEVINNEMLVIPSKDVSRYRSLISSAVDPVNYKKLFNKVYTKYILKKKEEFDKISLYLLKFIGYALSSFITRFMQQEIPENIDYIYYPLHVPEDFALTVRSPEFLDQLSIISYLCRIAPLGSKILIKEHPARVGAISPMRLRRLLSDHDNLMLLRPTINNHSVIKNAKVIVTINSKTGAESLYYNKPVIVLGDAFYKSAPSVIAGIPLSDISKEIIKSSINKDVNNLQYLQNVWDSTYDGELFLLEDENIDLFSKSITKALGVRP